MGYCSAQLVVACRHHVMAAHVLAEHASGMTAAIQEGHTMGKQF
jgi:hypothetical protein